MISHIREAAIRVCGQSLFWRQELRKINLLPGVFEYAFPTPLKAEVAVVFAALTDNRRLEVLTLEQAICRYPEWADLFSGVPSETAWSETDPNTWNAEEFNENTMNNSNPYNLVPAIIEKAGQPRVISQVSPHRFIVLPLPDDQRPYLTRIIAALKPSRSSSAIPQIVFDEVEDAVFHNALQHLMAIPSRPWSDPEQTTYHGRLARSEIARLRARANLTVHRGMMMAYGPHFV
jgi:hypothetical protein